MNKKEANRERLIFKRYGVTLAEYAVMLDDQDGVCAICRRPPKVKALHIDHDHKWKKIKVSATKDFMGYWVATATYRNHVVSASDQNRFFAIQAVKRLLKRASVRGLLCWSCNAGLQKFGDNPPSLSRAADYLREFMVGPEKAPPLDETEIVITGGNDEQEASSSSTDPDDGGNDRVLYGMAVTV